MILRALALGIFGGVITGLIPGIHVNLLSVILLTTSPLLLVHVSPIILCVGIISMAITHTFLDAIPSVFLGAPDTETVMHVLPGHKLLLEGKGYEAVKLTVIGSLLCLILGLLLVPVLWNLFPFLYDVVQPFIGLLLLGNVLFLLCKEKEKFWGIFIFSSSGILGLLVLNSFISQPLFPLLSGLFGTSSLVLALFSNSSLPKQYVTDMISLPSLEMIKSLGAGTISGGLVSLLPGMGSAQAAILSNVFVKINHEYAYLVLVGGINTVNFLLSLVTFATLSKARNGAVLVILALLEEGGLAITLLFLCVGLVAGGAASLLALLISKQAVVVVEKVPYKLMSFLVLVFIVLMVIVFSGIPGFIVLFVATALGMLAPLLGVGRHHAMGCLLVPVMLFFL
jgi:putative membrane protein